MGLSPRIPYTLADGTPVPSVTTVLGKYQEDSDGLLIWAARLADEGKDWRTERDLAATRGSLAHAMIEADIRGSAAPDLFEYPDRVVEEALRAFDAYRDFVGARGVRPYATEQRLVSEAFRFGGTFDALEMRDGDSRRVLIDWKTAKDVRDKMRVQLGAYAVLWTEARPEEPIDSALVVLLSPHGDGWEAHEIGGPELVLAGQEFLTLRAAYGLRDQRIRERRKWNAMLRKGAASGSGEAA
jgi:hypothetical protein